MRTVHLCILAMAGVLAVAGCRKTDIRTVTVSVPEMKNRACVKIIGDALSRRMGVKPDKLKFDLDGRQVEITYDSLFIAKKNIEFAIADAGFNANEIPANEESAAKLPLECRM